MRKNPNRGANEQSGMRSSPSLARKQRSAKLPPQTEYLLEAFDKMQEAFVKMFPEGHPDLITPHSWKVCVLLYKSKDSREPINKRDVIDKWRMIDATNALVGINKARDHIEEMAHLGFVQEYAIPELSPKTKYIKGTSKLWNALEGVLLVGFETIQEGFHPKQQRSGQ
jgi:hypothetical protein